MLSFLLALTAEPAPPPAPGPQVQVGAVDIPDEFKPAWNKRTDAIVMTEFVVPPETVDKWERMITTQLLVGAAFRMSVQDFYDNWQRGLATVCPEMTASQMWGEVEGSASIRADIACPRNPRTGLPENAAVVIVGGRENFFVVQVAFRHPIGKRDQKLIDHVVGSLKMCDGADLKGCEARKAGGFVSTGK